MPLYILNEAVYSFESVFAKSIMPTIGSEHVRNRQEASLGCTARRGCRNRAVTVDAWRMKDVPESTDIQALGRKMTG